MAVCVLPGTELAFAHEVKRSLALGPRNADLNDEHCRRIIDAFAEAGIPQLDLVHTIEAIAYVKFSKRERMLRQREREREVQDEIWGEAATQPD